MNCERVPGRREEDRLADQVSWWLPSGSVSPACPRLAAPSQSLTGPASAAASETDSAINSQHRSHSLVMRMSGGVRLLEAAQCFIATLGRLVSVPMSLHAHGPPPAAYIRRQLHGQKVGARVLANARLNQILQTGKST